MKYKLTVNEKQLGLINAAVEEYFRLRMLQTWDLADELARLTFHYDEDDPENRKKFDDYLERRNKTDKLLIEAMYAATGGKAISKTPEVNQAIDIWHVIRYQLWKDKPEPKSHNTVDSYHPIILSDEEPVTIERVEE